MPTYTYVCGSCGAEIERRQSFSDATLTVCESCSGPLRRVMHPVGVIFKGSGFYNTDYKNSNKNGSAGEDGAAKKTDAPAAEGSKPAEGESKPSEKPKSEPATISPTKSETSSKSDSAAKASTKTEN